MEHRGNLNFTFAGFMKEQERLIGLKLIVHDEHFIQKTINNKLDSIQGALDILKNQKVSNFNPEYAVRFLRTNLNWLNKQVTVIPESQDIIDEIEYVTKLLQDGKS